jgi:integrase
VDLVRGIIRRVPNKTARRNPKPVIVPIHPTLRAIFDDAHDVPDRGDQVLPELAALYRDHRTILNKSIQKHFLACGIRTQSPGAGQRASCEVGFHSLRHSFVSLCRAANAPLSVVESLVGHNSPAMTRHYTHTGEAAAGAAVAALPDITGQLAIALLPDSGSASAPGAFSKDSVRALAEKLTPKNAVAIRAKLLALTSDPA